MANYTKGKWEAVKDKQGRVHIMAFDDGAEQNVATLSVRSIEQVEANAHLIEAAVNACIKINPDNPVAVAESIQDMYEALKGLLSVSFALFTPEYKVAKEVLAKAEGKSDK